MAWTLHTRKAASATTPFPETWSGPTDVTVDRAAHGSAQRKRCARR
ncbi:hypothetical protein ACJ4Z0_03545 [Bifidobacterium catenulatum]